MANTKKKSTNKSSTRKTSTSTRKTTTKKKPAATKTQAKPKQVSMNFSDEPSLISVMFSKFSETRAFIPTVIILGIVLIIGLDLLFTLNDYSKFFFVLGIEVIIAFLVWLFFAALNTLNSNNNQNKDIQ